MTSWYDMAKATIAKVHADLPPFPSFNTRVRAVDAAYPFGERRHWPYKAWLRARKEYLARWSDKPAGPLDARPLDLDPYDGAAIADALSRTKED